MTKIYEALENADKERGEMTQGEAPRAILVKPDCTVTSKNPDGSPMLPESDARLLVDGVVSAVRRASGLGVFVQMEQDADAVLDVRCRFELVYLAYSGEPGEVTVQGSARVALRSRAGDELYARETLAIRHRTLGSPAELGKAKAALVETARAVATDLGRRLREEAAPKLARVPKSRLRSSKRFNVVIPQVEIVGKVPDGLAQAAQMSLALCAN